MKKIKLPTTKEFRSLSKESQEAYIDMLLNAKKYWDGFNYQLYSQKVEYDQEILEPLLSLTLLTKRSENTYFIHPTAQVPYITVEKEELVEKGYDQIFKEQFIIFPIHKDFGKERKLHATYLFMLLNSEDNVFSMSQDELAQEMKIGIATIKRHIASLKKMGLVEKQGRKFIINPDAIKPFAYVSKKEAQLLLAIEKEQMGTIITYTWLKANVVEGQGFFKAQILSNWGLKPNSKGEYNNKNYKELDVILESLENAHLLAIDKNLVKLKDDTIRSNTFKGKEPALYLVAIGYETQEQGTKTMKTTKTAHYYIHTEKKVIDGVVYIKHEESIDKFLFDMETIV